MAAAKRVPTKGLPFQATQISNRVALMRDVASNKSHYNLPSKEAQLAELDKLALAAMEMVVANLNYYRAAVDAQ